MRVDVVVIAEPRQRPLFVVDITVHMKIAMYLDRRRHSAI